ncbi:NAD(P)-dependent oxidoreductase [Nocardia neocaledoniensis]|uniref:imine reductase family protein n=1 Tax=Nocardia neocaledoniensis TaxID=236511 RepID=UPI0034076339
MNGPAGTSVVVIGSGVRAAALADALAQRNSVSRWGEEPDSGNGSRTAAEGAELMVVCVEDYEAAVRILGRAEPYLGSRDLVNVTSGTEAQARRLAAWVDARGGRYLDGALMAHPEHVGKPETMLVYSGSHEVFARHERLLGQLGGASYLGPDPGTAALYDVAMLNFAWATLTGYLYSAALLRTAGVRATGTAPLLTHWMSATITSVVTDYAEQIDNGRYPGDEEWLELDAPLMDHLVEAAEERGIDSELPRLIRALTHRGIAAGHGADSFASLIDVIAKSPRPDDDPHDREPG